MVGPKLERSEIGLVEKDEVEVRVDPDDDRAVAALLCVRLADRKDRAEREDRFDLGPGRDKAPGARIKRDLGRVAFGLLPVDERRVSVEWRPLLRAIACRASRRRIALTRGS